jgi:hypothetical protein
MSHVIQHIPLVWRLIFADLDFNVLFVLILMRRAYR